METLCWLPQFVYEGALIWLPINQEDLRQGNIFRYVDKDYRSNCYMVTSPPIRRINEGKEEWIIPNKEYVFDLS